LWALELTAGIQFMENEIKKYTRPSWKSNFHRSVRAVCLPKRAAALNSKMTRSKAIAVEVRLVHFDRQTGRPCHTEEESGVEELRACLGDDTGVKFGAPVGYHNEHGPIEESPMCQAQNTKNSNDNFLAIPQGDP
jgi:hypothetical protein